MAVAQASVKSKKGAMLSQFFSKSLSVFIVAVLGLQNNASMQFAFCPKSNCVFFPIIRQPPLVSVPSYVVTYTGKKNGGPVIAGAIVNNSNIGINNLVVSATVYGPGSGEQTVITGTSFYPYVSALAPKGVIPFALGLLGSGGGYFTPAFVSVLTWTNVITPQYQVASSTLISKSPAYTANGTVTNFTYVTVTVQNPYTQTLKDIDVFSWFFGRFSSNPYEDCELYRCISRQQISSLMPKRYKQ